MRQIAVLGSTGSIGTNTLEVIARYPRRFHLSAIAAGRNIPALIKQVELFQPQMVGLKNPQDADTLQKKFPHLKIVTGSTGLNDIVSLPDVDTVVSAIDGTTALNATLAAIKLGRRICLANKETLVAAGELINNALKESTSRIIPIDSEQSAIFQCLGEKSLQEQPARISDRIRSIILTASGGPFFRKDKESFRNITVKEALKHPTWNMGIKVTIDSATLMNKALEIIEAYYLFHLAPEQIDVVIHPQSIVHSMVEFKDSSIIAQLSVPDMKLPILYSLSYPERLESSASRMSFKEIQTLEFHPVDRDKFTSVTMAFDALKKGGSAGAVLNAANEVAVRHFIDGNIGFHNIFTVVEQIYYSENFHPVSNVEHITRTIEDTKRKTEEYINVTYGKQK